MLGFVGPNPLYNCNHIIKPYPPDNPMRQSLLCLAFIPLLLTNCTSPQAKPEPTVSPFITKPINKAKDTKTDVQQKARDHENLDPEKQQSGQ